MIDMTIRLFSFLVYAFLLSFFFSSWSVSTKMSILHILILIGLTGIVALTAYLLPSKINPFIYIIVTLIAMSTIATHYEVPVKDMFFWIVILLATNFISEALALAIFRLLMSAHYSSQNIIFTIATTSISMIIEVLMILALKLVFFSTYIYLESLKISVILALTSIPIVSIIVLFSFLMVNINISSHSTHSVLVIATGVLYVNLCILYLYSRLTKHLRQINQITLQNKSLAFEIKYIAELKKTQNQLIAMRHDLKNQFIVILGMLEENRTAEAKEYLLKSTDSLEKQQKFYTRDAVLNYLLNDKSKLAKKAKIKFDIKVLLAEQINVDNDILAILIGNLIDNALEASIRLKHNDHANISLIIKQFENKLLIDIENIYNPDELINRRDRIAYGVGTNNVKRIVNSYNGLYKQWTEGNKYFVSILLFNITKHKVGQN